MIKLIALKALPYNKIRMPGDHFEAKPGFAEFFIRAGLAKRADGTEPEPPKRAAPKPKVKAKGTYGKRALTAKDYLTTEMKAA